MSLFSSEGIKRKIAAWLISIINLLYPLTIFIPDLKPVLDTLEVGAQGLGAVAVVHAAASQTLSKSQILTASSIISLILFLSHFIALPAAILSALLKIQVTVAALGAGKTLIDGKNT